MALNFLNSPETQLNKDLQNNEVNGVCSRCGGCCNAAPLPTTKKEIKRIVAFVAANRLNRQNRNWLPEFKNEVPRDKNNPINIDLSCCFYDKVNRKCTIYPVRPAICREFKCSNNPVKREEIKDRLHRIADYNPIIMTKHEMPTKITNFDLLIYGDIIPLAIYMQYFTGMSAQDFNNIFNEFGCKDTYDLIQQLDLE